MLMISLLSSIFFFIGTIQVLKRVVGIFLDIVGVRHFKCFCDCCRKTVISLGLDESDDESYFKIAEITKKRYEDAINNAARSIDPDIRIYHNGGHMTVGKPDWARQNTHLELESLPTGGWGYDHFPKSVKYANQLGMEHLGMTGKFHLSWGEFGGFKHPNALRYEVALSLANGSKCSVGDQMHPYGFLDDATYELIGIAYAEAEAVEEYCYDIDCVEDVALLTVEGTFGDAERNHPSDTGANRILLEGKYLYAVIDEFCDFSKYKVIILPDKIPADGAIKDKLKEFVNGGGKLLCSGTSGLKDGKFEFDFGVSFLAKSRYNPTYFSPKYNALGLTPSNYVFYNDMDTRSFEATKDYLFETFAEEEGWLSIDEIPDCVVYHEIELEQRSEWDDFMADLDYIFSKDTYLMATDSYRKRNCHCIHHQGVPCHRKCTTAL